ncbi:MAG: Xaa-Pro dipeptidase [Chloroflexota bacterium]|nr:Xaa-Pro dipeptidase [Chloroflexota bacterium]
MTDPERRSRLQAEIAGLGADWALLSSPDAVCYATGMVVEIETGPSQFAGGPPIALVPRAGDPTLIVSDRESAAAHRADLDVGVVVYEGYAWDRPLRPTEHYRAALERAFAERSLGGRVASELATLPATVGAALRSRGVELVDVVPALASARATKTVREIERLRRAAELTAIGHRTIASVQAGQTELELFAAVRLAWETAAGGRQPAMGDLLSGIERTAGVLGGPTDRRIGLDEPIIADLVPRIDGYWGDTCSTIVVGRSSAAFRTMLGVVRNALETGAERLRPGIVAGDLDAAIRGVVERGGYRYEHHSGHGLGTAAHEAPRVVPGSTDVIAPGMVVSLEPGAYSPEIGGARLEWTFLVGSDGCEPLGPIDAVLGGGPAA